MPDIIDAFPLDPDEVVDSDGDGIGNTADRDDDGDGVSDSDDAFPFDPTESADTDSDGIGDNRDEDDDNDNIPDAVDDSPRGPEFLMMTVTESLIATMQIWMVMAFPRILLS